MADDKQLLLPLLLRPICVLKEEKRIEGESVLCKEQMEKRSLLNFNIKICPKMLIKWIVFEKNFIEMV